MTWDKDVLSYLKIPQAGMSFVDRSVPSQTSWYHPNRKNNQSAKDGNKGNRELSVEDSNAVCICP